MSDIDDPRDNPSQRVQEILLRTGTVSPWDFSRTTDEAVDHAAVTSRQDVQSKNLNWRPLGPRNLGGRIRCLVQDERNPRTIYAGSAQGGIWRTQDAGDSWTALDNFSPPKVRQALAVGAIGLSYSNPEILYVGTGEPTRDQWGGTRDIPGNGLFRSTDFGASFERIDHPDPSSGVLGFGQFENIVVDPWEPNRIWIASSDGGLGRGTPPSVSNKPPVLQKDDVIHILAPVAGSQQATDIMVNFGSARTTEPNIVTVYVALWNSGIFKANYDRSQDKYVNSGSGVWTDITPPFPGVYTRIKLTQCRNKPNWIGAVAAIAGNAASNVFISQDFGANWIDTGVRAGDTGAQARYDLLFGMHPIDPSIFVIGTLDIFLGRYDAGSGNTSWTKILDWLRHDFEDKAQHADQHAVVFDVSNPNRIWVGNDGGVSSSSDLGGNWRERGLGINAAQFFDITTHPTYPYMYAGGLQDNGTWLSYGGPSWYYMFGGDGGETAFQVNNPREFYMCWAPGGASAEDPVAPFRGVVKIQVRSTNNAFGSVRYMSRLPDVGTGNSVIESIYNYSFITSPFNGLFTGVLAHHPLIQNHVLLGRIGAVYLTTDGATYTRLTQLPIAAGDNVTKILYSPQNPNVSWWVTTSSGILFSTIDASASPWINVSPPALSGVSATITGFAINPNNDSIIAISATVRTATLSADPQSRIFVSGDAGVSWREISGISLPDQSALNNELNPSAATAVVFDPRSSGDVNDPQTLYIGCMAGVYVIRNVMVPIVASVLSGDSFAPEWKTFNQNLPLALIFDLETVTYTDAAGATKHLLRCATHARGAYECDLSGAPQVKLLVRDNIIDDGERYDATHLQANNYDPRLTPNPALTPDPSAMMPLSRAIDIRIDTPPYRFFGSILDGLEFDEKLISNDLSAGQRNIVYVQLHNYGYGISNSAQLHLYWARAGAVAPNLQSTFWNEFPDITDGDTWQKVDSMNLDFLESGQPKVLAFNWDVPGDLSGSIALLAVATDPIHDPLDTSSLGDIVDPASPTSFIGIERRTALFITDVVTSPADVSSRDGFDDTGMFNETAWGTQSYDIIVTQVAEATPNTVFTDLNDSRESDVLHGSATNHIYVRVHNQGGEALTNPSVEVFRVNLASINDPSVSSWQSLGTQSEASIPANSSVVFQSITWTNPPDPNPANHYILVALIQGDGDPRPDHLSRIDSIESFWQLILEDLDSGNAAVRRINWQA